MNNHPDQRLSKKIYITASCVIQDNTIYSNGKPVFENKEPGISGFLDAAYQHFIISYPKFHKMDNLSKLGLLATDILLKEDFKTKNYQPEQVGIVLANASASLDTDIKYYKTVNDMASPALFVYTLPNIVIGEICIRNNFKGENAFFVFKQFDATFIAQYVNNLFDNNVIDACICGWVELLGENYKAVLLLVEKQQSNQSAAYTTENINKIYGIAHG